MYLFESWVVGPQRVKEPKTNSYTHQKYCIESSHTGRVYVGHK